MTDEQLIRRKIQSEVATLEVQHRLFLAVRAAVAARQGKGWNRTHTEALRVALINAGAKSAWMSDRGSDTCVHVRLPEVDMFDEYGRLQRREPETRFYFHAGPLGNRAVMDTDMFDAQNRSDAGIPLQLAQMRELLYADDTRIKETLNTLTLLCERIKLFARVIPDYSSHLFSDTVRKSLQKAVNEVPGVSWR